MSVLTTQTIKPPIKSYIFHWQINQWIEDADIGNAKLVAVLVSENFVECFVTQLVNKVLELGTFSGFPDYLESSLMRTCCATKVVKAQRTFPGIVINICK